MQYKIRNNMNIEDIYIDCSKIKKGSREYYYLQRSIGWESNGFFVYYDETISRHNYTKLRLSPTVEENTTEVSFEEFRLALREQKPLNALLEEGDCIRYGNDYFTSMEYIYKIGDYFLTTWHRKTFNHKTGTWREEPKFEWGSRCASYAFDGLIGSFISKEEFDNFNSKTFTKDLVIPDKELEVLNKIGKEKIVEWLKHQ